MRPRGRASLSRGGGGKNLRRGGRIVTMDKGMDKQCAQSAEELAKQPGGRRPDGKILLHLKNLHCAACALDLEDELKKIRGVKEVRVDFITQTILLDAENDDAVRRVIRAAGHFDNVQVLDGDKAVAPKQSHRREILRILVAAVLFLTGILTGGLAEGRAALVLSRVLLSAAYMAVGYPVLLSTAKNLVKGRIFDENFLMTAASVGALCLGEWGEAAAVMLLYQTGELLQGVAVGASRRSVSELMKLKSETAVRIEGGEQRAVPPEQIAAGDVLLVRAGDRVAADGILLGEVATLDVKALTGEAEPKEVRKGEEILSGSINAGGVFEMKATRAYEDSAVKKILDLVENASAQKAAPEKFIAKFARYYTPAVCLLAGLIAVVVPLVLGFSNGGGYGGYFRRWVGTALNFLVISCPCALVISVPLTYFSGIGRCARSGILVKGATWLDVAAKADIVAFDKTGTLTEGGFSVSGAYPAEGVTEEELLSAVASAEKGSAHPIAGAFAEVAAAAADNVRELAGKGIRAELGGGKLLVGNAGLLKECGIEITEGESGRTQVYAALNGKYLGRVEMGDRLRPEAKEAISGLRDAGVKRVVMLTGDGEARARKIADELGMSEVKANLLPDEKLKCAEELKRGGTLMYVGDGINDAPVMAAADCSVSMGKLGSAAAVEASDFVLVSDDLRALPRCIRIARKMRRIVGQNIAFSIGMKAVFLAIGAAGILPLWLAVFGDVGVMLLAVLNSMRMQAGREKAQESGKAA